MVPVPEVRHKHGGFRSVELGFLFFQKYKEKLFGALTQKESFSDYISD